ncbi:MAG: agmatine deiminase family protein [Gammaproteobacteria bacterium]|nr:agmatine deiminase family protein [Gammaproteobacteria bacterium]
MTHIHFPAEWAPQDGVLLTWPNDRGDWAPYLVQVEPVFIAIAREVALRERLIISCYDSAHCQHVRDRLSAADVAMTRVSLHAIPANDTWARDHGPIAVYTNGTTRLLDFVFNGWGGKYPAELDNQITPRLAAAGAFAAQTTAVDLILEGGGIETDGAGALLTTTSCLLAPTRNPQLSQTELEARLRALLGVDRFLWLHNGHLEGDDTDGHIDTLARFCAVDTIAYQGCDDSQDPHFAALSAMAAELRGLQTRDGHPYRLVALPWPRPKRTAQDQRLPATYANFLVINGAVLVPTYNDPADAGALAALQACFPDRAIVPIDCSALILQYGSLHCVTMQLPQGVLPAVDE